MQHITLLLVFILAYTFINGQNAPNFQITDSEGLEHNLYEDYLDSGKIVVIKMFFVACPLCKPYNAPFQSLYEELGEGNEDVQFFLLTTRSNDSNEEVSSYRNDYGLSFPGSGEDGGGYLATEPYRNGDFGSFFGSPTFVIIEPDRTVHFDVSASGVQATIDLIKTTISEIQKGDSTGVDQTQINVSVSDYKGDSPPDYSIRLRSASNPDSSYTVPSQFTYPSSDYPFLSDAELYLEIDERNNEGITTIDLVLVQRNILGIFPLDPIQRLASDVNGSGTVTPSDLLSMRKVILAISDGFPIDRSYLSINAACRDNIDECQEVIKIDRSLSEQSVDFSVIKFGDVR